MSPEKSKDKVTLVEKEGKIAGFKVNGKGFFADMAGSIGRVEVKVDDLPDFNISSIPNGFFFFHGRFMNYMILLCLILHRKQFPSPKRQEFADFAFLFFRRLTFYQAIEKQIIDP